MRKGLILYALLALCLVSQARAAEKEVDTVVVTASRVAESGRATPQSILVIDSETLEKNQYESLAGLLQNYGLQIMSYGPNQTSSQITLRGFESDYSNPLNSNVLVLVNGAPIATTNLSMIPMDGIEQVEILQGPGSVQYGSSAMGGVINIIPRQGGDKFHLGAEAGGGSWNAWRALGSLSGKRNIFDFAGAVTWNRQGSNYTTGNGKLYSDTEVQGRLNYIMNFGVSFNEENRLGIVLLGAKDWDLGLNQSLSTEEQYGHLGFKADRVNSSADISYDGGYSPMGLSWKLRYFNAYDQSDYKYGKNPLYYNDYDIDINQSGFQGQASWNRDFLTLTGGVDHTYNKYGTNSLYSHDYEQTNTGGFGLIKLSFLEELLTLTGGVRFDGFDFRVNGKDKSMTNTSYSAGIALNPLDWLTLRGTYGTSYKVPSGLAVIGYNGGYGGVTGNPDLKPEKGYGWDAGLDIHWAGLKLALSYFSTLYADKIVSDYNYSTGMEKYHNLGGIAYYNGLEGQIGVDLGEFFEWDFTLRPYFNFTKMFNYNNNKGERIANVRDFDASFGVNFNYPEPGVNVDVRFNYLGYQKETYPHEMRTGGKTTMDIFYSQEIYEFEDGGKISLKAEIRNLTNENYAYRYDYPMPGRSFYIGARYDF